MSDWIKAINPTAPITTEAEAVRAARVSAIGVVIGVATGLVGVTQMILKRDQIIAAANAAATDPAVAGMGATIAQGALYFAIGMVVLQAIIAVVQWLKPNIFIPIIFAILVAGGLAMAVISTLMPSPVERPETPIWQWGLTIVIAVVQLVLHIAGARGASKLDKIRYDAANTFEN